MSLFAPLPATPVSVLDALAIVLFVSVWLSVSPTIAPVSPPAVSSFAPPVIPSPARVVTAVGVPPVTFTAPVELEIAANFVAVSAFPVTLPVRGPLKFARVVITPILLIEARFPKKVIAGDVPTVAKSVVPLDATVAFR